MERIHTPGFDSGEDARQQRLEWSVQRIVWPVLVALWLAIGLGLLGQGPLARSRVAAGDEISLEFQRFARRLSPAALEIRVVPRTDRLRLQLARSYTEAVDVQQVYPQPARMTGVEGATRLEFDVTPGRPFDVRLQTRPQSMGRVRGWVAVESGARLSFSQFVYP